MRGQCLPQNKCHMVMTGWFLVSSCIVGFFLKTDADAPNPLNSARTRPPQEGLIGGQTAANRHKVAGQRIMAESRLRPICSHRQAGRFQSGAAVQMPAYPRPRTSAPGR